MRRNRTARTRVEADPREEARALFELAGRLVLADSLDDVFAPALDAITHLLRVPRSAVLLFDADGVMRFKAWRDLSSEYRARVEGHSPWKPDASHAEPIVIPDAITDEALGALRSVVILEGIRSLAFIPLVASTGVIGKFMLYDGSPRAYSPDELRLCGTVATYVAQAVLRIRLLASERDARELAEAERERAREADRRKDEFLAVLGHELRNPLAPISTALHLMRLKADGALDREISLIDRQVAHLTRLVDDLLDLSRITRGTVQLSREPIELSALLSKSIELAGPLIEQKRHRLLLEIPPDAVLLGDPVRLAQIFTNLLTNAAKYTDPEGRIEISASAHDELVEVVIRDSGIGIPSDMLVRVFERFVQGHQSKERAHGGLGIGLSLVKSLVELHGGSVSAWSEGPGCGSTFRVRLPRIRVRAPSRARRPTPIARTGRPLRVLVVDDLEDVRMPLVEVLRQHGHDVAAAVDGPSALREAERFQPDAAIVDIGLPVMDGYELAARLRESAPEVRLLAVTGYGLDADREKSRLAGFERHFTKPVSPAELLRALDSPVG